MIIKINCLHLLQNIQNQTCIFWKKIIKNVKIFNFKFDVNEYNNDDFSDDDEDYANEMQQDE